MNVIIHGLLIVFGFLLITVILGMINQQFQRRHQRQLAEITGENPTEWENNSE